MHLILYTTHAITPGLFLSSLYLWVLPSVFVTRSIVFQILRHSSLPIVPFPVEFLLYFVVSSTTIQFSLNKEDFPTPSEHHKRKQKQHSSHSGWMDGYVRVCDFYSLAAKGIRITNRYVIMFPSPRILLSNVLYWLLLWGPWKCLVFFLVFFFACLCNCMSGLR